MKGEGELTQEKRLVEPLAYSVTELGKLLGIGRTKAYELVNSPEGPATVKVGKRIIVPKTALENWLHEQAQKSA